MKRYIIETDDRYIWTYEVEETETAFSCRLLKPHGDINYELEVSQDYWDWFCGEISHVKGAKIDICFLYLDSARENFQRFYELMPQSQFSHPGKAEWKSSEIIRYFQDFRKTKHEATYAAPPGRFILKNGETIIASGAGNFCLTNDAASINREDDDSKKVKPLSGKSRIKVFYPTPEVKKDKIVDTVQKTPSALVNKNWTRNIKNLT